MIISSSIINANFLNLAQDLNEITKANVDWLHIDVMDGGFVPNITLGPFILPFLKKQTGLPLDVHLMINNPEKHVKSFADAGANRISIHVENNPNILRTIQEIRELGVSPGIVLNPGTSPETIDSLLPFIDLVLIMTVNPGFSGQNFIPEMIDKIRYVKYLLTKSNREVLIQVDGGVNSKTIKQVTDAGADVIVAATAIFGHPNGISAGVNELRQAI